MSRTILSLTSIFFYFTFLASGLEVAPNSPCALRCIDNPNKGNVSDGWQSLTKPSDLSCFDWQYAGKNGTDEGKKFADCQSCLTLSAYKDKARGGVETDATWFVMNNRATVDWCLFGRYDEENNENISTTYPYKQCNSACEPIEGASDYKLSSGNPTEYDWCDIGGDYSKDAGDCISCLYNATGLTILGNIVTTLTAMCKSKPQIKMDFKADIYSASRIQLSTANPSTTTSSLSSPSSDKKSGISAGVIAGIVLGALVGIALILLGILFFLRRLKNKKVRAEILKGDGHDAVPQYIAQEVYKHDGPVQGTVYEVNGHRDPTELGGGQGVARPIGELGPNSPVTRT